MIVGKSNWNSKRSLFLFLHIKHDYSTNNGVELRGSHGNTKHDFTSGTKHADKGSEVWNDCQGYQVNCAFLKQKQGHLQYLSLAYDVTCRRHSVHTWPYTTLVERFSLKLKFFLNRSILFTNFIYIILTKVVPDNLKSCARIIRRGPRTILTKWIPRIVRSIVRYRIV